MFPKRKVIPKKETLPNIKTRLTNFSNQVFKMKPQEILKAKKELGALRIDENNPYFTLPLTINGKDIELDIEGSLPYGGYFRMNSWDQLKLCIEAKEDLVVLSKQLISDLKYLLNQETLPYFKLSVKDFINKDQHVYVHWPKARKEFGPVALYPGGEVYCGPNDVNFKKFETSLKDVKKVRVVTDLNVWCRQDHENHELIVGFTPKVRSIHLIE